MKKNDLKYDPFREQALKVVENVSNNKTQYLIAFLSTILAVTLLFTFYSGAKKTDLLQCLDLDTLLSSSIAKEYCESEEVQNILKEYKTKKPSTVEAAISLFYEIQATSEADRLEKIESINLSRLEDNIIKSKLYMVKADLMVDKGLFLESVDTYLRANKAYGDSKTFSGLIFYKISLAYFLDFNENGITESLKSASNYIGKSLNCEINNSRVLEAAEVLAARINHEI